MIEQPPIPQVGTALILNDMINGNLRTRSNPDHNKLIQESGIIQNSMTGRSPRSCPSLPAC